MRHQVHGSRFGRTFNARKGLFRSLVSALVEHGRIETTLAKAKELRRHVERAVTLGKKGSLHARRLLLARYPNKSTVETLMSDLAPRFKDRNGGYTRIVKTERRPGDSAEMAIIEFVDYKLPVKEEKTAVKKAAAKKPAKKAVAGKAPKKAKAKTAKKTTKK